MARTVINISMPERMRHFVEYRVKAGDYGTVSEYFRELIRKEQWIDASETAALIEERRNSLRSRRPNSEEYSGWAG